jgi:hypothetical protein
VLICGPHSTGLSQSMRMMAGPTDHAFDPPSSPDRSVISVNFINLAACSRGTYSRMIAFTQ